MNLGVIGLIALLTYLSRAAPLLVMPKPTERLRMILGRVPAPLFASLAITSLMEDGSLASLETVSAALAGLLLTWTRSLLWVLVGGVVGYGLAIWVLG